VSKNTACLACLALIATVSCSDRAGKLPEYGSVPRFTMTDSQGRPFDSNQLAGKVWIVDFIYTTCPGPCPRMTSDMHKLQQQQLKDESDVRLVSISVDPERDTPPVLNEFAHRFGGPTAQWVFLTGTPQTVHLLAHDTFKVGDVISDMDHSTKFMLVDKRGQLRGYYSSGDPEAASVLMQDIAALRRQSS